jgi:hypothetical protein
LAAFEVLAEVSVPDDGRGGTEVGAVGAAKVDGRPLKRFFSSEEFAGRTPKALKARPFRS